MAEPTKIRAGDWKRVGRELLVRCPKCGLMLPLAAPKAEPKQLDCGVCDFSGPVDLEG